MWLALEYDFVWQFFSHIDDCFKDTNQKDYLIWGRTIFVANVVSQIFSFTLAIFYTIIPSFDSELVSSSGDAGILFLPLCIFLDVG